uniref:Rad51 domain-containing protein n=1 Tax=Macrostomum lignano TaxID=282301 RepID=A0A1I8FRY3_9PLAT
MDVDSRKQRRKSRILLVDGSFASEAHDARFLAGPPAERPEWNSMRSLHRHWRPHRARLLWSAADYDFDTRRFAKKSAKLLTSWTLCEYAAMLSSALRQYSTLQHLSHAFNCRRHRRRDVFVGICPKFALTPRTKFVTKEAMRRILESLQPSWMEADLCYSWSRIPRAEEEKILELELMRSASQLAGYSRVSSNFIDPVDDFEGFESDSDAFGQIRISRGIHGRGQFVCGRAQP